MKEISKLSELMKEFLLDVEKKMDRKNKDIKVYDIWDEIIKKENIKGIVTLEDVREFSLIVHVKHPGMAQQIRLKSKKILSTFKARLPDLKVNRINVILKDNLNRIATNTVNDKE